MYLSVKNCMATMAFNRRKSELRGNVTSLPPARSYIFFFDSFFMDTFFGWGRVFNDARILSLSFSFDPCIMNALDGVGGRRD